MNSGTEPEKKPRRRVKKQRHHAGHHGGAWKVAYADFVTAMMALFLVLWLVSQADTKLKQAIASYFRSPGVFDSQSGGILEGPKKVSKEPTSMTSKDEEQALFGMASLLKKKFATRPEFGKDKDQVRIEMTEQGVRIEILDTADRISFESGSSDLTPGARKILNTIAEAICQLPNPLLIGGHTDRRVFPANSAYTNWELSADRANAARRALEAACVKPEQIERIVGYADTELLVPEDPYAMANRHISIIVMRIAGTERGARANSQAEPQSLPSAELNLEPHEGNGAKPSLPPTSEVHSPLQRKDVTVGLPDKIPANATRIREPAKAPLPMPSQ